MIWLRGYRFTERTLGPGDELDASRVDLCWTVGVGLSPIDIIRATEYQARHMRLALALGDPYRISRALSLEGLLHSVVGGAAREKGERLALRAAEIATRIDQPHAVGWAALSLAVVDWVAGRWRRSTRRLEGGLQTLRARDPEAAWQMAVTEIWFKIRNFYYLGELETFCAEAERATRAAEERGDLLTLLSARSSAMAYVHLVRDEPQVAREVCVAGLKSWTRGDAWHVQHQESLRMQIYCDLYEGDAAQAMARITSTWSRLKSSLLLHTEVERFLNFSTFLSAAVQARDLPAAMKWRHALSRQTLPVTRVWTSVADAGVRALRGAPDAAGAYEHAAVELDALEMTLFAAAARRRRGELLGGAEGAALVASVDALLRERGVTRPEHFARVLIS